MTGPDDAKALEAARNQTEAMQLLAAEVKKLRKSGRRTWKFVLFDVVLTVGLGVSSFVTAHALQSANSATVAAQAAKAAAKVAEADNRNLCLSSNVSRAQQIGLWDYLFQIAGPARTAQGAKLDAEFKQHLNSVFAPRDCASVNPAKP